MGSHNRRHLRPKFVHVGTLGVAAGTIALAGQASAQSVHVDGQGFVAISLSGWQLTADGRALVTLTDGSTHSLAAGQFQVIDNQLYVLESLITSDDMTPFDAGMMLTASAGAGALTIGTLAFAMGGSGDQGPVAPTQAQGTAVKGPLSGAFVYYDANGNAQYDVGEVSTRTGADGTYDLDLSGVTTHAANASVIVTTDAQTVDTSAGTTLSGLTFKTTAGSSVATPLTTLMIDTGLGSEALKQVLGLSIEADLNNFNPYAAGANATQALAAEQVSAQLASTLAGLTSAAIGSGADAAKAYDAALAALTTVINEHAASGTTLDLTNIGETGHLDDVQQAFIQQVARDDGLDIDLDNAVMDDAIQAISKVNKAITNLSDTDLTANANKGAFGLIQLMKDDIEQAARTGGDSTFADIDDTALDTLIADLAPTDIELSTSDAQNQVSIAEDTTSAVVGGLSAVDTDDTGADASGSVSFTIALVDGKAVSSNSSPFAINSENELIFTTQPDFETQSSYRVTVHATDAIGKTYAETFVILITDANDLPVIEGTATGSVTEDDSISTVSGQLSITDQDVGEAVFIAQSNVSTDYGTFSILANGAWTYTIDNSNDTVQGLGLDENGNPDTLTDVITVTAADGTETTVTITINGTNDLPDFDYNVTWYITEDTNVDDDGKLVLIEQFNIADRDEGEAFFKAQTNVLTTYGTFSIDANGNWTYAIDNSNDTVQGLGLDEHGKPDTLTDVITVTAADGTQASVTITINGANDAPEFRSTSDALPDGFVLNGVEDEDENENEIIMVVASAGDVNHDGIDDFIIGAAQTSESGRENFGQSYVVFGKAGGFDDSFDLASLADGDGTAGFVINGNNTNDYSGESVASAGDVNGDGIDDLIIGAPGATFGDNSFAGASYVVFGKAGGFDASFDLESFTDGNADASTGFVINGIAEDDESGKSVASAGDVNGDGYADLIIGAYGAAAGDAGASYVVFGKASGFDASFDLASLSDANADGSAGFVINGIAAEDNAGWSVSSAGDVNNDGFADLIIGAYNADPNGQSAAGTSFVVFGKEGGFGSSFDLASLANGGGTAGFVINGLAAGDNVGYSVSSAGDVNGDGYADLIIGADGADANGQSNAGASYVVFGKASGFDASFDLASLTDDNADGSAGFVINGLATDGNAGTSVASAGDINGDSIDDLIIGAIGENASYIVFGKRTHDVDGNLLENVGGSLELSDIATGDGSQGFVVKGIGFNDASGNSVAGAGDVNHDGIDDLIIGTESANASYVIYGQDSYDFAVLHLASMLDQEIPVYEVYVPENSTQTGYTATVVDRDKDEVTFSLSDSNENLFEIDPITGELSFKSAPNYEDYVGSNTHRVEVIANDGTDNDVSQIVFVTVTDVNEAPVDGWP